MYDNVDIGKQKPEPEPSHDDQRAEEPKVDLNVEDQQDLADTLQ